MIEQTSETRHHVLHGALKLIILNGVKMLPKNCFEHCSSTNHYELAEDIFCPHVSQGQAWPLSTTPLRQNPKCHLDQLASHKSPNLLKRDAQMCGSHPTDLALVESPSSGRRYVDGQRGAKPAFHQRTHDLQSAGEQEAGFEQELNRATAPSKRCHSM